MDIVERLKLIRCQTPVCWCEETGDCALMAAVGEIERLRSEIMGADRDALERIALYAAQINAYQIE